MPHLLKPKFEQYRASLIRESRSMRERDVVPVETALVGGLDRIPDCLVEKSRRVPRPEGMIEITLKFLGLAADQIELAALLKRSFPETELGLDEVQFWVGPSEEAVLVLFAGVKDERYVTGRILAIA
jgi:hypothetical protein